MRILDVIMRLLGRGAAEAPDLKAKLEQIKAAAPDVAPQADEILAALEQTISPDNLVTLGPEALGVVWDTVRLKFHPAKGAGDLI